MTRSLDIPSIAKPIERIGSHATNIGEHVVYMVKGLNVRHSPNAEVKAKVLGNCAIDKPDALVVPRAKSRARATFP